MSTRLEYHDEKSHKFWEISQDGCSVTTHWGRIGTEGQTKTKAFDSEEKATKDVEKQERGKRKKGYTDPGGSPVAAQAQPISTEKVELTDGIEVVVKGSGSARYTLSNKGGVFSCTCPAWRNQSLPIDARTCKHLRAYRGEEVEKARLGSLPERKTSEPKDAPPLLLAHVWEDQDPTGWWLSEKLDGVRAYWDGEKFVSRLGNTYHAPDWFTAGLPSFPLDGELYMGRGRFQDTVSVVRRIDGGEQWREVRYLVFDAPAVPGDFELRLQAAVDHFKHNPHEFAEVLDHRPCTGVDDLTTSLEEMDQAGGEGLMLREPGSAYEVGRSRTLLKVKSFLDTEAEVTSHTPGKGRHKGRVGALMAKLPNGKEFKVGTGLSDADRENPPPVGSTITIKFTEYTRAGVPRFPVYAGIREDV